MTLQTKVTGVILAGGRARRMNFQNKGLQLFRGKPLISYSFNALQPIVDELLINANTDFKEFEKFGVSVICDLTPDFSGALAGILAAITFTNTDLLIVVPCDAPFIETPQLQRLLDEHIKNNAEITVACTGQQIHSVFLIINTNLKTSLESYLAQGNHKVQLWFDRHKTHFVDFGENTTGFENINTLAELKT
jgi:molybdopterin-guanine dinucleotide biosynthesis protein A